MIAGELLAILCCPETHQSLEVAEQPLVERLNAHIETGQLCNRAGRVVQERIEGGLIRADRKWLYPVRRGIPIMLVDEALPV